MAFHDNTGISFLSWSRDRAGGEGIRFGGSFRTDNSCVYRMWIAGLYLIAYC